MRRNASGFTLVELVSAVAVLAIVLGLAAPAFGDLLARLRAQSAAAELTATLASARIHAVTRGGTTICPSQDGRGCSDGSDWTAGWIAFRGDASDRAPRDPADLFIVHGPLPQGVRIRSSAGRTRVRYLATGWASGTNLTLSVCVGSARLTKVVMNNAGRVRSERDESPCPST
ncbi:GspH/FimT family pseudopilin [Lysobacter xanthus]